MQSRWPRTCSRAASPGRRAQRQGPRWRGRWHRRRLCFYHLCPCVRFSYKRLFRNWRERQRPPHSAPAPRWPWGARAGPAPGAGVGVLRADGPAAWQGQSLPEVAASRPSVPPCHPTDCPSSLQEGHELEKQELGGTRGVREAAGGRGGLFTLGHGSRPDPWAGARGPPAGCRLSAHSPPALSRARKARWHFGFCLDSFSADPNLQAAGRCIRIALCQVGGSVETPAGNQRCSAPLVPGGLSLLPPLPHQACGVTWSTLRQESSPKQCGGRRHPESLASVPQKVEDTSLSPGTCHQLRG